MNNNKEKEVLERVDEKVRFLCSRAEIPAYANDIIPHLTTLLLSELKRRENEVLNEVNDMIEENADLGWRDIHTARENKECISDVNMTKVRAWFASRISSTLLSQVKQDE